MFGYLFAGQGSQYVGMGKDLYESFPQSRVIFEEADKVLGFSISKLCFEGPLEELTKTANCQPAIVTVSIAAWEAYERLGSPEGELAIAQCVLHLATSPKSNAIYRAFGAAQRAARETGSLMPPKHILNAPTRLMRDLGYSEGYVYDHDTEEAFSGQNYFPDGMERRSLYSPADRGFEREIKKRLDYWSKLRGEKAPRE